MLLQQRPIRKQTRLVSSAWWLFSTIIVSLLICSSFKTADIANMLCDLKSSPASGQTKVRTLAVKIDAATDSKATPSRSRGAALSREEVMAEKIYCQYKQLQMHLNSLPGNSNKMNPRMQESLQQPKQGPSHERARAKLASQHRAAHEMIQRRLLRAAERTMRLLVDSFISIEEARADLKATIQSHEEILVRIQFVMLQGCLACFL